MGVVPAGIRKGRPGVRRRPASRRRCRPKHASAVPLQARGARRCKSLPGHLLARRLRCRMDHEGAGSCHHGEQKQHGRWRPAPAECEGRGCVGGDEEGERILGAACGGYMLVERGRSGGGSTVSAPVETDADDSGVKGGQAAVTCERRRPLGVR